MLCEEADVPELHMEPFGAAWAASASRAYVRMG